MTLILFLSLSCASNATNNSEIELDEIHPISEEEVNISFDTEVKPYAVVNSSESETREEEPLVFIGERMEPKDEASESDETVRFVYLDESGNEIRQSIKKTSPSELLETQFNSSIETISSKRDFYNSIVEYNYKDGKVYDVMVNSTSVTDIRLEGGESISGNIALGERDNWTIDTTVSIENGSEILHFLIRAEDDFGETVLIVPTNRRTYYFRLIATKGRSMIGVRFKYKNSITKSNNFNSSATYQLTGQSGGLYDVDARNLSFNYRIESNNDIAPTSVFSNESSTFFQFDPRFIYQKSAPSLYLKRDNRLELINYTIRGNLYSTPTIIGENESFVFLEGENKTEIFREDI